MKGLIIKEKWANLILSGEKTVEVRSSDTKIRGDIYIIISGTKQAWGTAELVDTCKLDKDLFERTLKDKHKIEMTYEELLKIYKNPHGWIFKNVKKFETPIPYNHKKGCVIWVNIDTK